MSEDRDIQGLSLEELMARPLEKPTFPEQNADGIDLSLIRANLKLTPTERIRQAEAHADEILELNEVGRRHEDRP